MGAYSYIIILPQNTGKEKPFFWKIRKKNHETGNMNDLIIFCQGVAFFGRGGIMLALDKKER